jgi:VWFA-related protein
MRLWLALAVAGSLWAQDPPILFRERVTLVTVPVVVRDRQGRSVGSLKAEDFHLLDRGKAQVISRFAVETRSSKTAAGVQEERLGVTTAAPRSVVPERFIAYLFDDLHTDFGDLARTRDAAWEHMGSLGEGDRVAIYTTSGQTIAEFTDDWDQAHAALLKLMPRPRFNRIFNDCPDVSHYQADLILNRMDTVALNVAVAETMRCAKVERRIAEGIARGAASRVFSMGNQGTQIALATLREVVKRMAAAPGQRIILLASSGFVASQENFTRNEIVDRAIKANVTINALDARGLWVDSIFDASRSGFDAGDVQKAQIEREAQRVSSDIVADLAEGTGGKFFHNSNDLAGGFEKLAEAPEHVYVLGFSPENLKPDGTFHSLKVSVSREGKLTATARRGYYAPKQAAKPEELAKDEIQQALFSREEQREIPVGANIGPARSEDGKTHLVVVTRVPLKSLHYRVEAGRHRNSLTVAIAIFDRNGNWAAGNTSTVDLNVLPATLAGEEPAMQAKKTFELKSGTYAVRIVVRDSEERHLTARNATAQIP